MYHDTTGPQSIIHNAAIQKYENQKYFETNFLTEHFPNEYDYW